MNNQKSKNGKRSMEAKILKYKVRRSMKKAVFIKNGSVSDCTAIQIGKTFQKDDALKLLRILNNGF